MSYYLVQKYKSLQVINKSIETGSDFLEEGLIKCPKSRKKSHKKKSHSKMKSAIVVLPKEPIPMKKTSNNLTAGLFLVTTTAIQLFITCC
ncbi:hypothetical protein OSTOST_19835 [Ostertagia ostertagi]